MTQAAGGRKPPILINDINRIIHEPARFNIMAYLYVIQSAEFLFIQRQTGLTWGNLSSHLAKLEKAGYVAVEKEFIGKKPHTMLHLTSEGRTAFDHYRTNMKKILEYKNSNRKYHHPRVND